MLALHPTAWTALALSLALAACGGGGGDEDGEPAKSAAASKEIALKRASRDVAVGAGSVWVVGVAGTLTQVDPNSNEIVREIPIEDANSVAVGEDAVWVAGGDLTKVEPESGRTEKYSLGRQAPAVTLSYVAVGHGRVWLSGPESVTSVDPETGKVVGKPIRLPATPFAITAGPDAVFVGTGGAGLVEIDPRSRRVEKRRSDFLGDVVKAIAIGAGATWVITDSDLADFNDDYVEKIEVDSEGPTAPGVTRLVNAAEDVVADESTLWAVSPFENKVLRLDPADPNLKTLDEFEAPEEANALALGEGAVWAVGSGDEVLLRVDVPRE